jgi:PAS domain S-box-containing protein
MNDHDQTKEELLKELKELKGKHDALKSSYQADIKEKQQAIKALQKSEEIMHSIYRVAPTGIGVVVNRMLKDVNLRVCEMTGYTREELLGKNARILYPTQEDYEFVGNKKYEQIRAKGTGEVETRWRKKDGKIINVLLASTPIDLTDHNKGVVFTALDITERKKAEEALFKSESETRALLDGIPESAFLFDVDGFVIAANATVAQRLNIDREKLISSNIYNTVPKDVADHRRKFVSQVLKTGQQVQFQDIRFGRIIDNRVNPVFDPDGKISRLAVIGIDVTDRIKAEEALKESEEKFRGLADSAKVMISIVADACGGKFLYVNDEWRRVLDYSKEEEIDIKPIDTVAPEDRQMVLEHAAKRMEGKPAPSNYEIKIITRSGEKKHLDFSATTIKFGNQEVILTSSIDITERKKTEEELRQKEEMMRTSQSVAHICSYSTNLNTDELGKSFWVCSPEFYKIFGIDESYPHTIEGWSNFIHPDFREEVMAYHNSVVKEKKSFDREYKIIRINDGKERWVHGTGELVFDEKGNPIRMHGAIQDITDRKKFELALQKNEEIMNETQQISKIGGWEWDIRRQSMTWTDEVYRIHDLDPQKTKQKGQELINLGVNYYHPDYRSNIAEAFKQCIENGEPYDMELPFTSAKGRNLWVRTTAKAIKEKNKIVRLIGNIMDITDRKMAEEALYKSKRSLESFLKISQTINTTMDIDNVLQMVVDKASEVLGLNSGAIYQLENETLRLMAATSPLPKNLPEEVRLANLNDHPHVKKAITTGQPVIMADALKTKLTPAEAEIVKLRNLRSNLYLPIKTKNHTTGVLILTSLETTHVFGAEEINHIQGFANQAAHIIENARNYYETQSYAQALEKEIFERNRAEKALKASEQRFRNILHNVKTVAVQGYTMDGTVIYWNQASTDFYGFTEQEALGKNLLDLIIPTKLKEVVRNEIKTMRETGKSIPASELTLTRKDGSPITVYSSHSYVKLPGKQAEFFCIDTDLTERKKAEDVHKELEIAQKTAQFKQNFLANMSHEIRTPLTGVLGMIEIMEQTALSPNQKDYLNTIKLSGENLREIINQVLDYSKIEAGKIALHPQIFEFRSLPLTAISLYKNNVKTGVKFQNTIDSNIPLWMEADNARLAQVLNNLVSNAVKFTSEGVISIQSSLVSAKPQNGQVVVKLEVTDTGPGIPEDSHQKLFIPFSQVEAIDTRNFEGTGLGLSICKQLVEMMGGEIGMTSEEGKGSTFWFTFPAQIANKSAIALKEKDAGSFSGKLRILLAEDKIVNQKVVKLMLTSMGHEVQIANNGQKAIDLFQPGLFDLILMDIQMPVMNGITATQILKEKYTMLPPIVGLSANAFEGDRPKYMALGMDEYLTKPVKKEDFNGMIRKLF